MSVFCSSSTKKVLQLRRMAALNYFPRWYLDYSAAGTGAVAWVVVLRISISHLLGESPWNTSKPSPTKPFAFLYTSASGSKIKKLHTAGLMRACVFYPRLRTINTYKDGTMVASRAFRAKNKKLWKMMAVLHKVQFTIRLIFC
jgi:hypothetical protein